MQLNAAGDRRLEGRVAVVTGAARAHGIGRAICLRFAAEGARVAVLDLDAAGAQQVAAEITAAAARPSASAATCATWPPARPRRPA